MLGRKKQEEEQKTKKLQQIEEDRKMAEELHKQRLEREVHVHVGGEGRRTDVSLKYTASLVYLPSCK